MSKLALLKNQTWIDNGKNINAGVVGTDFPNLDMPFRYFNLARIQNILMPNGLLATLIEWDTETVPAASIGYMIDALAKQPAPYIFRYFKKAWYSEQINDLQTAARRIEEIQDLRAVVPLRSYVSIERDARDVPQSLIDLLQTPEQLQSVAVISKVDANGEFPIVSVGDESLFNKSNYGEIADDQILITDDNKKIDEMMTTVYEQTVSKGALFFDECTRFVPNAYQSEPIWLRYTRVLVPVRGDDGWNIMSLCLQDLADPVNGEIFGLPGREVDIDLL